jgi:membrane protein implicated in regulation of membrane protease activity
MSWEGFYFGCFLVGFLFSVLSFLAGSGHLHLHLPGGAHGQVGGKGPQSPVNVGTIAAFLAWFGGTGYLLTRYSNVWALLALGLAVLSGLAGAAAVFWFLVKVLMADEQELDPADYDMIGALGRVSSTVRVGGTGEMIFSQAGARRAASIRSESGEAIAKGVEVVVTRFEKGIAYVRRWEEISESSSPSSSSQ